MSIHEQISSDIDLLIHDRQDADIITPASIAVALQVRYTNKALPAKIAYASLEHLKQMARKRLARRFDADADDSDAYAEQGELFSGHLQDRYPIPKKSGDEPAYKRRELLSPDERAWNVKMLRKSADARLAHADALEAEGLDRSAA